MKVIIRFLILYSFCLQTSNAQENKEFDPFLIFGKWTISATKTIEKQSESKILCNSCPEITFDTDNFAYVKFPNQEVERYMWRIDSDKLLFLTVGEIKNPKLDSQYLLKLNNTKEFVELELIEQSKNYSYIIRK
jgi:hypothetical protein